jgi:hypothetical protein
VIDRDPGPGHGQWRDRKGVMQFHHPHHFHGSESGRRSSRRFIVGREAYLGR